MSFNAALILDIALAVVLVGTVITAARRGLVTTLLRLGGMAVSMFAAYYVSGHLSPEVFERFFKGSLIRQTSEMIASDGQMTIQNIVDKLVPILPQELVAQLLGGADKLAQMLDTTTPDIAAQIVDNVIAPLFLPIISVMVFFVTFAVCSFVVRFVAAAFINLNRVPLVGDVNRLFGTVAGLVLGIIYVMLLLCGAWAVVVITGDNLSWFSSATLESSFFYRLFASYNPFV